MFLIRTGWVESGSICPVTPCRIGWRHDWAWVGHDPQLGIREAAFSETVFLRIAPAEDEQASPPGLASGFFPWGLVSTWDPLV